MAAVTTASTVVKLLKETIKDYNYWGESESDTPLQIYQTKGAITDEKILSLDKSMRAKAVGTEGYKAPERVIETKTLDEVFKPLVANSLLEIQSVANGIQNGTQNIPDLGKPVEAAEYYVEIYSAFKIMSETKVCYVRDNANDPYTGLFIVGTNQTGVNDKGEPTYETVYARGLLVQT